MKYLKDYDTMSSVLIFEMLNESIDYRKISSSIKNHIDKLDTSSITEYLSDLINKLKKLPKKRKLTLLGVILPIFLTSVSENDIDKVLVNNDIEYASSDIKKLTDTDEIDYLELVSHDKERVSNIPVDILNKLNDKNAKLYKKLNISPSEYKLKDHIFNKNVNAKPAQELTTSDSGISHIKKHEGAVGKNGAPELTAYDLKDGKITVGWGHAEDIKKSKFSDGDVISEADAIKLFKSDLKYAEKVIHDIFNIWTNDGIEIKISQNMFDAMVSVAFNTGRGAIFRSDFIQAIKVGDFKTAAKLLKTHRVGGKYSDSIKNRRNSEYETFKADLKYDNKSDDVTSYDYYY